MFGIFTYWSKLQLYNARYFKSNKHIRKFQIVISHDTYNLFNNTIYANNLTYVCVQFLLFPNKLESYFDDV